MPRPSPITPRLPLPNIRSAGLVLPPPSQTQLAAHSLFDSPNSLEESHASKRELVDSSEELTNSLSKSPDSPEELVTSPEELRGSLVRLCARQMKPHKLERDSYSLGKSQSRFNAPVGWSNFPPDSAPHSRFGASLPQDHENHPQNPLLSRRFVRAVHRVLRPHWRLSNL